MTEHTVTSTVKLSANDQAALQRQKRAQRVNNEQYFRVHPELRQMTSAFISALLADKPDDVHLYAEQFFTNPELAHSLGLYGWSRPVSPEPEEAPYEAEDEYGEDELNPELEGGTGMDVVDLENLLIELFKEADTDNSGTLDPAEFAGLMATAQLGLSKQELKFLLADADENSDGSISYAEFVPLAVEVVQTMRLKQRYEDYAADIGEEMRWGAEQIIGPPDGITAAVQQAGSKMGVSALSKGQLKSLLKQPALGLSKQQASMAAAAVPYDEGDTVAISWLCEELYGILVDTVAEGLAQQNLGAVGEEIEAVFKFYDKEDTGLIDKKVAKTALNQAFPFLTRLQVSSLVGDAPVDLDGQITWRPYLPKLEAVIKAFADPEALKERAELAVRAEFQPVAMMNNMDRAKFDEQMTMLFKEADKDNSGALDLNELAALLKSGDLGLSPSDAEGLMEHFDVDMSSQMELPEFLDCAYDVLAALAREKAIMNVMYEG